MKTVAEISYGDLMDLLFILADLACEYHDIDHGIEELTMAQFTEWLETQDGIVKLKRGPGREP